MATDAKLMLNTFWGEFGHPMNMTGTWQRLDKMRWQKTEAPRACRAAAAVDTHEGLDPRVKCGLWRWAITRTGVSASDASYLDVLDEHIVTYIIQLASWGVVQDKKEMGWARIHAEYLLLPRCPVHHTVIIFLFVTLLMTRGHTWFFSFRCYGCGRETRETLGFDVFAPLQKRPGGITANTMSTVARFV